ncbi:Gfo/Idh/MocA family protein [Rhodobacter capsulatus]|uniref:Gfo/Idh/MocA family protein n=1 Tax=Rhodobacter capsulatus TaxID=1061 RepID=UPI004038DF6F
MQPVNFGILGASDFAARRMGPAIHAARGARLAALATSAPAKAAGFTAFAPDLTLHESYEALLADPAIEAVYIPLPNHLHVDWGIRALQAGKHVLIEKPLALRAEEIDPLIAARDASGKCAAEAYMIVHHPQWQLARRWLDEGRIGRLKHADVAFTFDNPDPANIRNRAETGGGSIPDIGVYAYSSIRFAARAEPVRLASRIKRENGVDTFAQVWGEMAGPGGGVHLCRDDLDPAFPAPGGDLAGRDRPDHPLGAVQRRGLRSGRGDAARLQQRRDPPLPRGEPICTAGRSLCPPHPRRRTLPLDAGRGAQGTGDDRSGARGRDLRARPGALPPDPRDIWGKMNTWPFILPQISRGESRRTG